VGFTRFFCLAFGDNHVKTNDDTPILPVTKSVCYKQFLATWGLCG